MPKKRSIKTVKANCDRLVREVIRARDVVCQRCGGRINLQVAHVKIRKYNCTRWDLLNLLLLCSNDPCTGHRGCHEWFDRDVISGARWFEEKFKARADYLAEIEQNYDWKTWRLSDYEEVESFLKKKLKEMKEGE